MSIGAEVYLWGTRIGTVVQEERHSIPIFKYDNAFTRSGIEVSPLMMPLSNAVYTFPELREETFYGLPGLLADSLPDKFGTKLIDSYLSRLGRDGKQLSAVERLCYVGSRGMGALEFRPQIGLESVDREIDIDSLAKLADQVLADRKDIKVQANDEAMGQLLKIGTSAGGARAKALIAWNEEKKDIRSGQIDAGEGYGYWLLKFGTIANNKDKDAESDHIEYSKIEYAYSLMAKDAGIDMTECRLIKSAEGLHFMTRRFDRDKDNGKKIHMQSLGGLAHFDFNLPGMHSYEEAASIMRKLGLSHSDVEQLYRRMVFNEVAKNYDDHVKNISFLMNKEGKWSLAPAYDMTFSYNPGSMWTSSHQMLINGKKDGVSLHDLRETGKSMNLAQRRIEVIIQEVVSVVREWPKYADFVELPESVAKWIEGYHMYSEHCIGYHAKTDVLDMQRGKGTSYIEL